MPSSLIAHNVLTGRARTSMRLEPELWDALHEICAREQISRNQLIRLIAEIGHPIGLTSSVRVYVLKYFMRKAGAGI